MQLTIKQIIDETIEYYKTHNRSVDRLGDCYYYLDGNMCSVGRCMIDAKYNSGLGSVTRIVDKIKRGIIKVKDAVNFDGLLQEKYRGHTVKFWCELQNLHDIESYWNKIDKGWELTYSGSKKVSKMLKAFK